MRIKALAFAASFLLVSSPSGIPQSASSTSSSLPQAAGLLAQSVKALTGLGGVSDATLTGTAEWIAGSDDETGTATYKGVSGTYRLDLSLSNGTRSEIVSNVSGVALGSWVGLDGISHAIADHNLMVDGGWFLPFTLGALSSSPNSVLTYVGQETRNGASVIHLTFSQMFPGLSGDSVSLVTHLTQANIYLDPATLLPVSYAFNSHPDDNAALDIPTEMRYSNYQNIGGGQLPLHVQKFINNTLAVDLQFQKASLNTGLTAAQISAQ